MLSTVLCPVTIGLSAIIAEIIVDTTSTYETTKKNILSKKLHPSILKSNWNMDEGKAANINCSKKITKKARPGTGI